MARKLAKYQTAFSKTTEKEKLKCRKFKKRKTLIEEKQRNWKKLKHKTKQWESNPDEQVKG